MELPMIAETGATPCFEHWESQLRPQDLLLILTTYLTTHLFSDEPSAVLQVAERLLNRKLATTEIQNVIRQAVRESDDPSLRKLLEELDGIRSKRAEIVLQGPGYTCKRQ